MLLYALVTRCCPLGLAEWAGPYGKCILTVLVFGFFVTCLCGASVLAYSFLLLVGAPPVETPATSQFAPHCSFAVENSKTSNLDWVFGKAVKTALGMPMCNISWVLEFKPHLCFRFQLPTDAHTSRQQVMIQVFGSLSLMCETWIAFPAPSFALDQPAIMGI